MPDSKNGNAAKEGRLTRERREAASNIYTKEITDPEVEEALVAHCRTIEGTTEAARAHSKASSELKAGLSAIKGMRLKDGDRVRIGEYIVPFVSRAGGGIKVPAWGPKLVAGKPQKITSNA